MDIDYVISKFDISINSMLNDRTLSEGYNEQMKNNLYSKLLLELAMYYFKRERYMEGIHKLVTCLSSAIKINNSNDIIQCVALFERYRSFASKEIEGIYYNLMEEAYSYYEIKKIIAILLFSAIIVCFPTILIKVQDQIYSLLAHGDGML